MLDLLNKNEKYGSLYENIDTLITDIIFHLNMTYNTNAKFNKPSDEDKLLLHWQINETKSGIIKLKLYFVDSIEISELIFKTVRAHLGLWKYFIVSSKKNILEITFIYEN